MRVRHARELQSHQTGDIANWNGMEIEMGHENKWAKRNEHEIDEMYLVALSCVEPRTKYYPHEQ